MADAQAVEWLKGIDDQSGFSLCTITHQAACTCETKVGSVVCESIRNAILADRPRLDRMRDAIRMEPPLGMPA